MPVAVGSRVRDDRHDDVCWGHVMGAAFETRYRRCLPFPGSPDMPVTRGRDFACQALGQWGLFGRAPRPGLIDDVLLVTSELLSNACVHGHGIDRLTLEHRPGVLRVEVTDHNPARPHCRAPEPGLPHGYGLLVVQYLAVCWGTTVHHDGKTVWAELLTTRPRWC